MTALALSFHEVQFDIIDRNSQPWLRSQQISVALGYSRGDQANDLYSRNADEFTEAMTALVELETSSGGKQQVRIFSLRGCHLLGMWREPKSPRNSASGSWIFWIGRPATTSSLPPSPLKPCPDEEGIKTARVLAHTRLRLSLKPCPDEEGIKTTAFSLAVFALHFETLP